MMAESSLPLWAALGGLGIAVMTILKRTPSVVKGPVFTGIGWVYDQSLGTLSYGTYLAGSGYSGAGNGQNNPQMEMDANLGPIPQGQYQIQAPVDDPHMGPYALELLPTGGQNMYGRSGFFIHGDSVEHPGSASEGCIIMPRAVREQIWESGDTLLQVVA